MKRYVSAEEAAEMLGVSRATVYSYVSRGVIRSEAGEGSSRARRYNAEDVQKLRDRKAYRRDPGLAAQDALHWGTPVLDSALTLIADDRLYYRGKDATVLARTAALEEAAALLWTGNPAGAGTLFAIMPEMVALEKVDRTMTAMQRMTVVLAMADDLAAYHTNREALARTGARIVALLTAALTTEPPRGERIARQLARGWGLDDNKYAESLINAALVLCADHELNASSFTARVVASTGATLYAVVTAGLAALSGNKHGGNTDAVRALLREIRTPERVEPVIRARMQRGERIPGFGHTIYAGQDPRAEALFVLLQHAYLDRSGVSTSDEVTFSRMAARMITSIIELQPNIDYALVALERALRLPDGAALALFALGRSVGWIAHGMEQYRTNALIRPRARYVGEKPGR